MVQETGADGVVVGSALVRLLEGTDPAEGARRLARGVERAFGRAGADNGLGTGPGARSACGIGAGVPMDAAMVASRALAFSASGDRLFVGTTGWPYLHVYNTSDWSKQDDPIVVPGGAVDGLSVGDAGATLAVRCRSATPVLLFYNTADMSVREVIDAPATAVGSCAFSNTTVMTELEPFWTSRVRATEVV